MGYLQQQRIDYRVCALHLEASAHEMVVANRCIFYTFVVFFLGPILHFGSKCHICLSSKIVVQKCNNKTVVTKFWFTLANYLLTLLPLCNTHAIKGNKPH